MRKWKTGAESKLFDSPSFMSEAWNTGHASGSGDLRSLEKRSGSGHTVALELSLAGTIRNWDWAGSGRRVGIPGSYFHA